MDDGRGHAQRSSDEAAIRALEAAYDAAWDAADLQALTAPFTPDATIVDPFGGVSTGRARSSGCSGRCSRERARVHARRQDRRRALRDRRRGPRGRRSRDRGPQRARWDRPAADRAPLHRRPGARRRRLAHRPDPRLRVHGGTPAVTSAPHIIDERNHHV